MLPRKYKLSNTDDIARVKKSLNKKQNDLFIIYCDDRVNDKNTRFCVVVSKSVSNKAVVRNKVKRIIYSFLNENYPRIKEGCDNIIIVKKSALGKEKEEIYESLGKLLNSIHLLL